MGLHYPFGYTGHEVDFLNTFVNLLDTFCSHCHTNEDVKFNCMKCPVGNLVEASKEYLLNAHESKNFKEERLLIKRIKKEIKNIEPCPLFNPNWIWDTKRTDMLEDLRKLKLDYEYLNGKWYRLHMVKEEHKKRLISNAIKQAEEKMNQIKRKVKKNAKKTKS